MPRRGFSLPASLLLSIAAAPGPATADQVILRMSQADCKRLVEHLPAPDVDHAPGVDVRGRAVAPADLDNGARIDLPEVVSILVDVDLFERLGIPANPTGTEATAIIGVVDLHDGRAFFNGRLLQGRAQAELAAKCREAGNEAE